jgi:acyl-CoA reductase-like NAD-dependent aldehyde dehydrogenase
MTQLIENPANAAPSPVGQPTFDVLNPATGEAIKQLPVHNAEHVASAVQRARSAQVGWAAMTYKERESIMLRWRSKILANKDRMVETMVAENGKPRQEALIEILYIADVIGYYSKNAAKFLKDRKVPLHLLKNKGALVTYHPFGVVGVISPWNFPLILSFGDAISALAAGNAIVVKPSEITPMTALLMAELAEGVGFPDGLIQIVTGMADTGVALIDNVDIIVFTGSTATGKKVMERASRRLIPVILELGGKDPMIVLQDADLERAVNGALTGGFFNNGQVCISVERVYVEEPIYDRFVDLLSQKVAKLRVASDADEPYKRDVGPLTFKKQLEIVERQVEDARQRGANILTGGKRTDRPGFFYEPTLLTNVTDDMLVMKEETFGPLLPIVKVKSADEAIRRANASNYGLSSSLWTKDKARGIELAKRVEAGSTCVNDVIINYTMPEIPFGGIKESGIGYRHGGADSLKKFCRPQSIVTDRLGLKWELIWMPYGKPVANGLKFVLDALFKRKY